MLELVDENVQWLNVSGAKISVEVEGNEALRQSMGRYFKSCPSGMGSDCRQSDHGDGAGQLDR